MSTDRSDIRLLGMQIWMAVKTGIAAIARSKRLLTFECGYLLILNVSTGLKIRRETIASLDVTIMHR